MPPFKFRAWMLWVLIGLHLGIFSLYMQPDFLFLVANLGWSCF